MVIVLAREDGEVHLHALKNMTEQFQLREWGHCHFLKSTSLFGNNVWIMGCT
jgi:hypothetical protein